MNIKDNANKFPVCPRCRGFIPSNEFPGMYPGALSRADNKTEVCSECGREEALCNYNGADALPVEQWPILNVDRFIEALEVLNSKQEA